MADVIELAWQYGRYGYRKIAGLLRQAGCLISYDFVEDRTHDGRRYRMLNVLDEFTHECLAIRVARKLKAIDVILFILRGVPGYIRSDKGPEFVAQAVQDWIATVVPRPLTLTDGAPWENGYIESFNAAFAISWTRGQTHQSGGSGLRPPLRRHHLPVIQNLPAPSSAGCVACKLPFACWA
jgi:putative transposase